MSAKKRSEACANAAVSVRDAETFEKAYAAMGIVIEDARQPLIAALTKLRTEHKAALDKLAAVEAACSIPDAWDMSCNLDNSRGEPCVFVSTLRSITNG